MPTDRLRMPGDAARSRGQGNAAPTRVVRGATTGLQRTYRGPTRRSEALLSDPDRLRPAVPDPQQDRHVSFPDDAPDDVSSGAPDGVPGVGAAPSGPALPPEAWAPRPFGHDPSRQEPTGWSAPVSPTLTTPPARPARRRRRSGWLLLLVPLLLGHFSSGSDEYSYSGGSSSGIEVPMGGDLPPGVDPMSVDPVTVELAGDTSGVLPALPGKPKTVAVVSLPTADADPSADVLVQTFANDSATDTSSSALPFAATVHLNERPSRLHVTASVVSGPGQLQCRVYAGSRLVAISTGGATVTCTPEM